MHDAVHAAPASHAQQRMWFFDRLQPGSALYSVQHVERLSGPWDADALRRALDELIRRHDALRTTFSDRAGRLMQIPAPPAPASLAILDVTERPAELRAQEADRLLREETARGFDLEHGPLVRFTAIVLEPERQLLLLAAHHVVFDLWSVGIFRRELSILYEAFRAGRPSPLPDPPLSYVAFVADQRVRFDAGAEDPQLISWRKALKGLPATSELPADKPRPSVQTYRGAMRNFALPPTLVEAFRRLTRGADATLFMSLFGAYAVLLHRHSGQTDLAVGTPIANRGKPGLADMIGLLINTIVLRVDLDGDPSVVDLLGRVRAAALDAFANQDVPFERLIDDLKPERDPSRHPLFQTMFVFQQGFRTADAATPAPSSDRVSNGAKFDLTLTLVDEGAAISGSFEYNTDLFTPGTIDRLVGHFETIAAAMAAKPHGRISRLAMMGEAERRQIVEGWNRTDAPVPARICIHHLFERAAACHPDAVAVESGSGALTYGALDLRATALAGRLRDLGVGPEERVGICAERSLDWTVAIMAILKAGGALVPLDPSFPSSRLRFMLEDAGVALVLTDAARMPNLREATRRCCVSTAACRWSRPAPWKQRCARRTSPMWSIRPARPAGRRA